MALARARDRSARRTIELAGVEGAFRVCNDVEVAVGEAREAAGK